MNGIRSTLRAVKFGHSCATWSMMALAATVGMAFLNASPSFAEEPETSPAQMTQKRRDPANTLGVQRGDCKKCHPSEVASWMKMTHFQAADLRLFSFTGNTKKYAEALNISSADLLQNSMCADCHGTKADVNGEVKVISGVSCESCHGASGGPDGWLNRHQSFHDSQPVARQLETPEHRKQRQEACDKAGLIRIGNVYSQARACLSCHLITNEELIVAGHKASSAAFEYASWTEGETRHNFLLDRTVNAPAPSLYLESTPGKAAERKRMKFVLGKLALLEMTLRARAVAKNPAVIPQVGGSVAAINGALSQVTAMAPNPQTTAINGDIGLMLGTLFVGQENDAEVYGAAADKVAKLAQEFASENDGSKLEPLDPLIDATPPYFSQNFKQRFLGNQ